MATTKATQKDTPKEQRTYYIVNPAGAVHAATYDHARWRLATAGWRSATAAEVAEYKNRGGNQVFDNPIAARWQAEPVEVEVPEEAGGADEVAQRGQESK